MPFKVRATIAGRELLFGKPGGQPFTDPGEAIPIQAFLRGSRFYPEPPDPTCLPEWHGADPQAEIVMIAPPGANKPNPFDALPEAARHVKLQPPTPRAKPTP